MNMQMNSRFYQVTSRDALNHGAKFIEIQLRKTKPHIFSHPPAPNLDERILNLPFFDQQHVVQDWLIGWLIDRLLFDIRSARESFTHKHGGVTVVVAVYCHLQRFWYFSCKICICYLLFAKITWEVFTFGVTSVQCSWPEIVLKNWLYVFYNWQRL